MLYICGMFIERIVYADDLMLISESIIKLVGYACYK